MKLIVGLGNPGKEFEGTRHNAGFMIINCIVKQEQLTLSKTKKIDAEFAKGTVNKKRVILAKPTTFMNNSGIAVRALMEFYKLTAEDLIVIHDDKDIVLGKTKVQFDRGPAGHNGVKSIMEQIGSQGFTRIRVGVAPANPKDIKDTSGFVLGKFNNDEKKILNKVQENILKELEALI